MSVDDLVHRIQQREMPALARAISLVENGRGGYEQVLSALHTHVGRSHRVGITGPPGAGKSTLVERLVHAYREQSDTVAVVAVDPTSPFSGGALLGDRIRMESVSLDPGVFIRSMASRGGVGGLATTTREVCDVLDAFGFDHIIIETIGVGQSELAIAASADTTVLVLVPESGDGIQVLKAGVMEIADLYVVNKADRPGADRLVQEVQVMLGIRRGNAYRHMAPHHRPSSDSGDSGTVGRGASETTGDGGRRRRADGHDAVWEPVVLTTVAKEGTGVSDVLDAVSVHRTFLQESGDLENLRRDRLARHTREVVDRTLRHMVWDDGGGEKVLRAGLDDVVYGRISPYRLADEIIADLQRRATDG